MKLRSLAAAAAFLSITAAGAAHADNLKFNYSGEDGSSFSFDLSSMPSPDNYDFDDFTHFTVAGVENGVAQQIGIAFYNSNSLGGLSTDDNAFNFQGQESGGVSIYQQVYDGTEDSPAFSTGSYRMYYNNQIDAAFKTDIIGPPQPDQIYAGTLDVTEADSISAAPEPATWALMLGGIGILGGMMRVARARRREDEATGMIGA